MFFNDARNGCARLICVQPLDDTAIRSTKMFVGEVKKPYSFVQSGRARQWPEATFPLVYRTSHTPQLATVENGVYFECMSRVVRNAMLSMRVSPAIRLATENVLGAPRAECHGGNRDVFPSDDHRPTHSVRSSGHRPSDLHTVAPGLGENISGG
jgi:hypothetical protein